MPRRRWRADHHGRRDLGAGEGSAGISGWGRGIESEGAVGGEVWVGFRRVVTRKDQLGRPSMTAILRAALVAVLAVSSIPAVAAGQDTSAASLLRRIQLLEQANADLAQRVLELESRIKSQPSLSLP